MTSAGTAPEAAPAGYPARMDQDNNMSPRAKRIVLWTLAPLAIFIAVAYVIGQSFS